MESGTRRVAARGTGAARSATAAADDHRVGRIVGARGAQPDVAARDVEHLLQIRHIQRAVCRRHIGRYLEIIDNILDRQGVDMTRYLVAERGVAERYLIRRTARVASVIVGVAACVAIPAVLPKRLVDDRGLRVRRKRGVVGRVQVDVERVVLVDLPGARELYRCSIARRYPRKYLNHIIASDRLQHQILLIRTIAVHINGNDVAFDRVSWSRGTRPPSSINSNCYTHTLITVTGISIEGISPRALTIIWMSSSTVTGTRRAS